MCDFKSERCKALLKGVLINLRTSTLSTYTLPSLLASHFSFRFEKSFSYSIPYSKPNLKVPSTTPADARFLFVYLFVYLFISIYLFVLFFVYLIFPPFLHYIIIVTIIFLRCTIITTITRLQDLELQGGGVGGVGEGQNIGKLIMCPLG